MAWFDSLIDSFEGMLAGFAPRPDDETDACVNIEDLLGLEEGLVLSESADRPISNLLHNWDVHRHIADVQQNFAGYYLHGPKYSPEFGLRDSQHLLKWIWIVSKTSTKSPKR